MAEEEQKTEEKKPTKEKISKKKSEYYEIAGETVKRKKSCPKCGPGIFLAQHKNRMHCGKCGYTEMAGGNSDDASAVQEAQAETVEEPKKEEK